MKCPYCKYEIKDLWDHSWSADEVCDMKCDWCDTYFYVVRDVSVSYEAKKHHNPCECGAESTHYTVDGPDSKYCCAKYPSCCK